ncbi:MAG: L,D-transpeptidase [Ectobacillus sp.]
MEELPKQTRRNVVFVLGIALIAFLALLGGGYTYAKAQQAVKVHSLSGLSSQYSLKEDEEALKKYLTPVPKQLIIINRYKNELAFFENGHLAQVFPVSTGKNSSPTPEGVFPIVNKIKNRPYYKRNIPGGAPNNPLGDRWIGLDIFGTNGTTYAIHGNSNPSTIGYHVSDGCIRMYNPDVRSLFEKVEVGTLVIIKDFEQPWDMVALEHDFKVSM